MEMSDDHVTKIARGSSSDIISDLPSSILERILSFLPLQDVVRTSILSTKWKDRWSTLPHLVFDEEAFKGIFPSSEQQDLMLKIKRIIDKVLLQHTCPILHFTFSIKCMKSCSDINHWIKFISSHAVEKFTLELWTGQPHQLSSRFFSLQQLKYLKLLNCVVNRPPSFNGFKRLISIDFTKVTLSADLLECFISTCPLLKNLFLVYVVGLDTLSINAPNLQLFYFIGNIKYVCFKNTPRLKRSIILLLRVPESAGRILPTNSSNLVNVLGCPSQMIELLWFNCCTLKFLGTGIVPKILPTTFNRLGDLFLTQISFKDLDWVDCALCLIRSSPNLKKLVFNILVSPSSSVDTEQAVMFWKAQDSQYCLFNKLQTIDMKGISGNKPEMEFIKYMLANSPVLEKAIFEPNGEDLSYKRFETLKDLTRFPRASSIAEIIYLDDGNNS